jgi:signal transduction histidine kinase
VRRVPIRLKLTAALVIPLIGLLTVTWLEVRSISEEVADVKARAALAEASLGPSSLLTALQQERAAAAVYMIGQEQNFALEMDYPEAREFVDAARAKTRRWVEEDPDGELAHAYGPSLDALAALDGIRTEVEAIPDGSRNLANATHSGELFDRYSELMQPLFDANREISFSIEDDGLRRGVDLYSLVAQQTDTLALLVKDLIIPAALGQQLDDPANVRLVSAELADLRAREQAIRTKAEGVYGPMAERLFATDHIVALPQLAQEAIDTGNIRLAEIIQNSLGTDPETFGYLVFRDDLQAEITHQATEARAAADARLLRYLVLGGMASVLAVGVTLAVSLSITRPLRSLDRQARDLATERLPVAVRDILETPLGDDVQVPSMRPIEVKSRDEVGDVVTALNTVQDSALDLAIEQAVMRRNLADSFVNLGRRNQNLLSRQLDFITVLEASEVQPNVLASLFRLDHLATRMRRNAESLLVLAGIDPPRKWSAPLRLNDVVRAALGEVEDYHRVTAQDLGPVTVMGSVGADLAHLVAELVENALTFSSPDDEVEVRGRPRTDGGFTVAIIDAGSGMTDHELIAANRRLAGAESFTVAPSKYLGHYVAGHLADRHGIGLHLEPRATTTGITAVIDLPPALLVAAAPPLGAGPGAGTARPAPAPAAPAPSAAWAPQASPTGGVAVLDPAPVRPLPVDAPAPLPPPARAGAGPGGGLPPVHPAAPWGSQVPAAVPPPGSSPAVAPRPTPGPGPGWSPPGPRPGPGNGTPTRPGSGPGWSSPASRPGPGSGAATAPGSSPPAPRPGPGPGAPTGPGSGPGWSAPASRPGPGPGAATGPGSGLGWSAPAPRPSPGNGAPTGPGAGPGRAPLARRRPGAQAVSTSVPQVRRTEGPAVDSEPPRSPEAVHDFIANFAAGVRQGQAQARRRRPPNR